MSAPRVFAARYQGTCRRCDEAIRPGDWVAYDGTALCHDQCTDDDATRPVAICPACHLARPCWCGDEP